MRKFKWLNLVQLAICVLTLVSGGMLYLSGMKWAASWVWGSGACVVLAGVLLDTVAALWRKQFGMDLIALVSIVGALALQEILTAAVIALMFASAARASSSRP